MATEKLALGLSIAGGAISTALVEVLFEKGILTLAEARTVLDRAMRNIAPHSQSDGGQEAMEIIVALMRGKFTERGKTP